MFIKRCIVIDNNDPDQLGRIQVRVIPEMADVEVSLLPWAEPFLGMSTVDKQSFNPVAIDSVLWVAVRESWKSYYFIDEYCVTSKIDFAKLTAIIDGIADLGSYSYNEVRVDSFEDGTIKFHNIISGDMAMIHSSGTYIVIKADGTVISVVGDARIEQASDLTTIDMGGSKAELGSSGSVKITASTEIQLATGDSVSWQPNVLNSCLFTGAPHGGTTAGISKLKGGA
jgi:hypothetical protein